MWVKLCCLHKWIFGRRGGGGGAEFDSVSYFDEGAKEKRETDSVELSRPALAASQFASFGRGSCDRLAVLDGE